MNPIEPYVPPVSTGNTHAPASNTAAVLTYAAIAAGPTSPKSHVVSGITWSYSGTPTGGNLKVEDGAGNIVFTMDITAGGAGFLPWSGRGSPNTAMIVTLAAGGSGVSGKVSVMQHWTA